MLFCISLVNNCQDVPTLLISYEPVYSLDWFSYYAVQLFMIYSKYIKELKLKLNDRFLFFIYTLKLNDRSGTSLKFNHKLSERSYWYCTVLYINNRYVT